MMVAASLVPLTGERPSQKEANLLMEGIVMIDKRFHKSYEQFCCSFIFSQCVSRAQVLSSVGTGLAESICDTY